MRLILTLFFSFTALGEIPSYCNYDEECLIEVSGSRCADGTPSFLTLTRRRDAKHLLVYLKGGGACWDGKSCLSGIARPLTRVVHGTEWNHGSGIHDHYSSTNPFASGFDIVSIPYCTGDAFTGNNTIQYTDGKEPLTVAHVGYENVRLSLERARQLFPSPDKAVLLGCSAGGIGAFFHLRNFRQTFPNARRFVISDAGLPFKPPHVVAAKYDRAMKHWGADKFLNDVPGYSPTSPNQNFGDVVRMNTQLFNDTRFGFISSYRDAVMTFFGLTFGSSVGLKIVHNNIIDIADNFIGNNQGHARVFFSETATHCHSLIDLSTQISLNTPLSEWLTHMINDEPWNNIRPDLNKRVQTADETAAFESLFQFPNYP